MSRIVKVAATQMACSADKADNINAAELLVRAAALQGANIILLQELFEGLYFCQEQKDAFFDWAHEEEGHPLIARFSALASELGVVIPLSFFEKANNAFYNSVVVIDTDGKSLGKYRKSHIPDGPGYQEKFYFTPGDTGFKVFHTQLCCIGVGICWDQWFPECARAMVLQGAEVLLYPTAIGSEPTDPSYDSSQHWARTMQGHSAANMVPVVASNRIGREDAFLGQQQQKEGGEREKGQVEGFLSSVTFYGGSFITNNTGEVVAQADRETRGLLVAELDLARYERERRSWGVFRDRRPDLYAPLLTKDGRR